MYSAFKKRTRLSKLQVGCRRLSPRHLLHRITTLIFSLATTFVVQLINTPGIQADQNQHPNIIVIMADDLGYGDLSCYGATEIQTPQIDQLASRGLKFRRGYCSASTCTPTRYSLLTGKYAFRQKGTGIAPPNSPLIIPEQTFTLPDLLKQAGYQTAVIGKWHLGLGGETGPEWNGTLTPGPAELGFDYHLLLPTTNDRVPQVYVENSHVLNLDAADPLWVGNNKPSEDHPTGITHRETLKMDWSHGHNGTIHNGISRIGFYTGGHAARFRDEDLADRWVKESVRWIEEQAKQPEPFFLFFASHDLHVPRMPHERFQGKSKLGYRGDSILQLDWCVGELMAAVERNHLTEQTLFVFCSDNGPVMDDGYKDEALEKQGEHLPAGPYRGGKYSIYEGGTRTPLITSWPGTITAGESNELVCTIDLAASFAGMTGTKLPEGAFPDSSDVHGALLGKSAATGRTELILQDNGQAGNYGFLSGQWKLHRHDGKKTRNLNVGTELTNTNVARYQLFDLENDPREIKDLVAESPEKFVELKTRLQQLIDQGDSL